MLIDWTPKPDETADREVWRGTIDGRRAFTLAQTEKGGWLLFSVWDPEPHVVTDRELGKRLAHEIVLALVAANMNEIMWRNTE